MLCEELESKDAEVFHNVDGTRLAVDSRFQDMGICGIVLERLEEYDQNMDGILIHKNMIWIGFIYGI